MTFIVKHHKWPRKELSCLALHYDLFDHAVSCFKGLITKALSPYLLLALITLPLPPFKLYNDLNVLCFVFLFYCTGMTEYNKKYRGGEAFNIAGLQSGGIKRCYCANH